MQANQSLDNIPLTRREVIKAMIQTSYLRFQGVNLATADLRKLDFRNINLYMLRGLNGTKLQYLTRLGTKLQYLTRLGLRQMFSAGIGERFMCKYGRCQFPCLQFRNPSGLRTNLEGINLKGVCLESSNIAGVNLRVANLKDGIMKNCNLRAAVLAGADLKRCNLSGSDLQEANLRGVNLKNAELTLRRTNADYSA
ncbi:uncharacterized protein ACN427_007238 [Glossina fuscipes fuscipes]